MSRAEELIAAYLDDSLTKRESAELHAWLRADAANVRRFVLANAREEQLREAVLSSGTLRVVVAKQSPRPVVVRRTYRARAILAWAAAVVLMAVLVWSFVQRANHEPLVTLVQVNGPVSWRNDHGERVERLQKGARLAAGTLAVEGEGSRAEVTFTDGSTFALSGGSELTLGERKGKQLFLRRGALLANVSPQPAGRPLRIRTPTAEAMVLGTSFGMNAVETETFLRVNSGAVELRRLADNQALKVSVHEQVRAGVNTAQPMRPEPATAMPDHWSADSASLPGASWIGEWRTPGVLAAVPRMTFVKEDDVVEIHHHAGVVNGFPGFVTLREDSVVRVRYRIQRPLNVGVFLSTHTKEGAFSGNFQGYIEESKTPADADGWRTATVPMKSLWPIRVEPMPFQPGCVAGIIFVTTFADDVDLEVAELEVSSKSPP
jgi:ferric-dicitrate binding protein FerR (iron transport regulator)